MPLSSSAVLVRGTGPRPCSVAIYGEAPGRLENNYGRPFVGDSGAILTTFLNWFGVARHTVFISNLVKYWPGEGNPDPSPADIQRDAILLEEELSEVRPRLIIALGRYSARHFLGDPNADMDLIHGIPHQGIEGRIVVPVFHPAAGLHDPSMAQKTWMGLRAACDFINDPDPAKVWAPSPKRIKVTRVTLRAPEIINATAAIDTEGVPGKPYSIQYSRWPDEAVVVAADQAHFLDFCGPVIFHNAKYDVRMCEEMGVTLPSPRLWEDTMVRAYCRQDLPHGLKALSYRVLRRPMSSFDDVVRRHFDPLALEYLETVASVKGWSRPEESLVEDKTTGRLKIYRPNPTHRRAEGILKTYAKKPGTDLANLWFNITEEQRAEITDALGPFPKYGIEIVPQKEADQYGGTDAASTLEIHNLISADPVPEVYPQDVARIPALVEIETTGLPFSLKKSAALAERFKEESFAVRDEMRELSDTPTLNPASVKQIGFILFKTWGIKSSRRTKLTGDDSSDDRALSTLALQWSPKTDPFSTKVKRFVYLLQEHRELRKMFGTYAGPTALPSRCKDGRVHPRLNNTQVVSGRLSSPDPNLQNIPSRTERGRLIRGCFVAPKGHTLLSVDYSQIELRILAHESGDPALIEAFMGAEDLHRKTEKYIFGVPDERAGEKRTAAKTFNFRIAYAGPSGSPRGLQEQLFLDGIVLSVSACADYRDRWFAMYPQVASFLVSAGDEARRLGYAETSGGRRRYLPFARLAEVPRARAEAERQAGNLKIQGAAQEVITEAMIRWDRWGRRKANQITPTTLCMQIHDELLFEVGTRDPETLSTVARLLVRMMLKNTGHFKVPILAEAKAGTNWGQQEKLKL